MHCISCGTTLPPGIATCPTCGTPTQQEIVADPPIYEGSSPFPSPSAPYGSAPGFPAYRPPQPFPPTSTQGGTMPDLPAYRPAPPSPSPYTPQPSYFSPPPQQLPPYQEPPRPQNSPRRALGSMTIVSIIVALLVLASGVGLIYYTTVFHPGQLHAQATATVQTFQTTQAQVTATANVQATGTTQAITNATATAQAVATAQVVATATALQNIYTQATSGSPALNDPLNGNFNNWQVGSGNTGESCEFRGGAYHITEPNKNFYLPCFAQGTNFSNFAFQVKMTIVKGDSGGLVFRADSANSKFYVFSIDRNGTFALLLSQSSNPGKTLIVGPSSALNTGLNQSNLLTVVVRGHGIYLYINKQFTEHVRDSTYSSGTIGLFAADDTSPTDVAFSNLQVWTL